MTALAENLWEVLLDKALRHVFAETAIDRLLAKQIRENRRARGWTQGELARRSGLALVTIVRYEVTCKNAKIQHLTALAGAFDCALIIRFVGWRELIAIMADGVCIVPSFSQEVEALEAEGP